MGVKGELSNNCAGWGLAFITLHGKLSRLCAAHQTGGGGIVLGRGTGRGAAAGGSPPSPPPAAVAGGTRDAGSGGSKDAQPCGSGFPAQISPACPRRGGRQPRASVPGGQRAPCHRPRGSCRCVHVPAGSCHPPCARDASAELRAPRLTPIFGGAERAGGQRLRAEGARGPAPLL